MLILAVTGWRHWADWEFIFNELDKILFRQTFHRLHLRVGDADGADAITSDWWMARDRVTGHKYKANVEKFGWPAAGPIRNRDMLMGAEEDGIPAQLLIAFPQPGVKMRSPGSGTTGCLIEAAFMGIRVEIPGYKK